MRIVNRKLRKYKESLDHTTYYNSKGDVVPSVTTVLKVIAKESLIYWANSLGWKRKSVKRELDESSKVGTYVHLYIEAYITDNKKEVSSILKEIENCTYDERNQILNGIDSFRQWWQHNENNFEIIECEKEMSCDEYGGTADLIAKYKGKLVILDFKTSKSFYFTMFLQLAAYAFMYKFKYGIRPKDVAVLRMDKYNGKPAELLWLSDLPGGDLDFYYISYKRALDLFENIHILDQDWSHIK